MFSPLMSFKINLAFFNHITSASHRSRDSCDSVPTVRGRACDEHAAAAAQERRAKSSSLWSNACHKLRQLFVTTYESARKKKRNYNGFFFRELCSANARLTLGPPQKMFYRGLAAIQPGPLSRAPGARLTGSWLYRRQPPGMLTFIWRTYPLNRWGLYADPISTGGRRY